MSESGITSIRDFFVQHLPISNNGEVTIQACVCRCCLHYAPHIASGTVCKTVARCEELRALDTAKRGLFEPAKTGLPLLRRKQQIVESMEVGVV